MFRYVGHVGGEIGIMFGFQVGYASPIRKTFAVISVLYGRGIAEEYDAFATEFFGAVEEVTLAFTPCPVKFQIICQVGFGTA